MGPTNDDGGGEGPPRGGPIASLWSWFAIGAVVAVGFVVLSLVALFTLPFDRRRWLVGRSFRRMGIVASQLVPTWRFRTFGEIPRRIAPRTVVVSNHASQADPFLISRLPWEMKWMAKRSLFKAPVFGWCMRLAGDVPIERGDASSAGKAIAGCRRWLDRGVPVMFFPEGTRSRTGALGPFKDGAFRLAIDAGADILPIAVDGTRDALPKHSWRFGRSGARVAVGTPISTAGMTSDDVEKLKGEARARIEALLEKMRATPE